MSEAFNSKNLIPKEYELGRLLGRGRFGEVYYAEDIRYSPPRKLAIKLLYHNYVSNPALLYEAIKKEASILARFNHPNILGIVTFDVKEYGAYIVTGLAEGGSLEERIRPDPTKPALQLPFLEVANYLDQIAAALDEAHANGLIHRDIKPANILLDQRNRLLLADFGLATVISATQSSTLIDIDKAGTPQYMAPEQWMGQAGKASDIYALGVVVYQLITGRTPYNGNSLEVMGQHWQAPIPTISEHSTELGYPPALDQVINAVLNKNPQQRLRSASKFAQLFRSALNGEKLDFEIQNQPAISPATPWPSVQPIPHIKSTKPVIKPLSNRRLVKPLELPPTVKAHDSFPGHRDHIYSLVFSPDSQYIASASADNTIRLWEVATGQLVYNLTGHNQAIRSVSFSPDGSLLASASLDNTVRLWEVSTGHPLHVLARHADSVWSVAFCPTGQFLASGSDDKKVMLWNMKDGRYLHQFSGHRNSVNAVTFSADGQLLASGGWDKTIKLWEMKGGQLAGNIEDTISFLNSLMFSPDGKLLVAGCRDGRIRVWKLGNIQLLLNIPGHVDSVNATVFSPDGETMASASSDKMIKLWKFTGYPPGNITGCKELTSFRGHTGPIHSVVFSPDGTMLASAGEDTQIKLWKVAELV